MDNLIRLLLRFLLVPLGYVAAVIAGTLVILFGSWRLGELAMIADPDLRTFALFGFVIGGPILLVVLMSLMWLPGAIGILIAEAFALRSWIFHAANGAASAYLGWQMVGDFDASKIPLNEPMPIIAAGLAGGFAYWAIAGWNAGFWKPVFRRNPAGAGADGTLRPPPPTTW
jgi:hypothetical protein